MLAGKLKLRFKQTPDIKVKTLQTVNNVGYIYNLFNVMNYDKKDLLKYVCMYVLCVCVLRESKLTEKKS